MAAKPKSKLARAVAQFNAAFQYDFRLPADVDTIKRLIELCMLRGRDDIAALFRAGLREKGQL